MFQAQVMDSKNELTVYRMGLFLDRVIIPSQ